MPRAGSSNAATGEAVDEASSVKPGGARLTRVAMATSSRPARAAARRAAGPARATRQLGAAELADLGGLDDAAERLREQLHAVTDAEHRDAELEQRRVELRRARRVHRGRAAREDQALRRAPRDLGGADVGAAGAPRRRRTRGHGARSAASTGRRSRRPATSSAPGAHAAPGCGAGLASALATPPRVDERRGAPLAA